MTDDLSALITGLAQRAKEASRVLATASTEQKNAVLRRAAEALRGQAGDRVLFGKWSGTEVKIDGEDLLIMKESDIMGVIEATAKKKKAA